jgi:hypothetical protein
LTRALGRRCTLQGFVFVQLIDKKKRSKQLHEYLKDVIGQLGKKKIFGEECRDVNPCLDLWPYLFLAAG